MSWFFVKYKMHIEVFLLFRNDIHTTETCKFKTNQKLKTVSIKLEQQRTTLFQASTSF